MTYIKGALASKVQTLYIAGTFLGVFLRQNKHFDQPVGLTLERDVLDWTSFPLLPETSSSV